MIDVALTSHYVNTIADGIRLRAWKEPQLTALQEQLRQINLFPSVNEAIDAEPIFFCHLLETSFSKRPAEKSSFVDKLIPRGWVYQNMATVVNASEKTLEGSVKPGEQIVFPAQVKPAFAWAEQAGSPLHSLYNFMADIEMPNTAKAIQNTAMLQTYLNEALTACALERYHLARKEYPDTLDALVPNFLDKLPHDVIDGGPLHYKRDGNGAFLLYSIGWNEKDDGGQRPKPDDQIGTQGDWVWPPGP